MLRPDVADRFRGRRRPTARPARGGLCADLECIGQHQTLRSGDYFLREDPIVQRVACMDACRQALYSLVTGDSVSIELESHVGTQVTARTLSEASIDDLHRASIDVTPSDSVSQIGPPTHHDPEVQVQLEERSVVSRATQQNGRAPRPAQRLTRVR